ncbi:MAG: TAT-variant-translocated molybdopterin oxidoreductase, partial [Pseudooceanicola sp.]
MSATGDLWRSLEEALDDAALRDWIEAEFPAYAAELEGGVDRRQALRLMAAGLAMGGLAGCKPEEKLVPWVKQPENIVPGVPRRYATTLPSEGFGIGAIVECHEGRPTKVEGNPDHPSSGGATDAVMQAACLELFDPTRLRTPRVAGSPASWAEAERELRRMGENAARRGGGGTAILVGPDTSPTLRRQLAGLRDRFRNLRVFRHAPLRGNGWGQATLAMIGQEAEQYPRIADATVVVSLDDDFLAAGPGRLAHARAFAEARRVRAPGDAMLRLHALESTPTLTGAAADEHVSVRPSAVPARARALLAMLDGAEVEGLPDEERQWLKHAARDLKAAGTRGLVLAGDHQDPALAGLALQINDHIGALGRTLTLIPRPDDLETDGDLAALCDAIRAGDVAHVLNATFDPVGTASSVTGVEDAFESLETFVTLAMHSDSTGDLADWQLPAAHTFEAWSDLRAHDGTASVVQPLIRPLFAGRSLHDVLDMLAGEAVPEGAVRRTWRELDDAAWREAL